MMKDKTNVVTGHKILDKNVVEGDVKVCENCTIGGVDVSYWGANAVRRTGNFTVSAPVNFVDNNIRKSFEAGRKIGRCLV